MRILSKSIVCLLLAATLFFISGCGGGKAVPTENEAKTAIESHVITFANLSPNIIISPVKVTGIDSFKLLETYNENYDFTKLADKFNSQADLKYLNVTKKSYKGDWAIVKVSYSVRFGNTSGAGGVGPQDNNTVGTQWFLMQKPENGKWEVSMPLTAAE
jgi:hypothetical protein